MHAPSACVSVEEMFAEFSSSVNGIRVASSRATTAESDTSLVYATYNVLLVQTPTEKFLSRLRGYAGERGLIPCFPASMQESHQRQDLCFIHE